MAFVRIIILTTITMIAFAANSVLCRLALSHSDIDAASFTSIRLVSGALMLWLIVRMRNRSISLQGNWSSALALFAYAAGFSFAYLSLPTATGALLLFGAVQTTMIGAGIHAGERLYARQILGLASAVAGLVILLSPGLSAPPLTGSVLMIGAGIAWGIYSLRGSSSADPLSVSAGNFLRAAPITILMSALLWRYSSLDAAGIWYAVLSGALASGLGYALWYRVLPALKATHASTVQLSVPLIAALGGVVWLGESLTLRLVLSSLAILGGIALVLLSKTVSGHS